jgi:hypothetical protein
MTVGFCCSNDSSRQMPTAVRAVAVVCCALLLSCAAAAASNCTALRRDACEDARFRPTCAWFENACRRNCASQYTNGAACDSDPYCQWLPYVVTGSCQHFCPVYTDIPGIGPSTAAQLCNGDAACGWNGTACRSLCSERYRTAAGCRGDATCFWAAPEEGVPHCITYVAPSNGN